MAHNLCYSTLLQESDAKLMNPNDYTLTPNGGINLLIYIA